MEQYRPEPTDTQPKENFNQVDRLHTDVLEAKYGLITPEVVRHDNEMREAFLNDQERICRTYALTFFSPEDRSDEIIAIDQEIREGASIGKAFREHEYGIRKNVIDVFTLNVPDWLKDRFKVEEDFAKARISEFYARKHDQEPVIYGRVLEAYTPDFRNAVVNSVDMEQVSATTACLEKLGFTKEDIWNRIGRGNDWSDAEEQLLQAREESFKELFYLKDRIYEYMHQDR